MSLSARCQEIGSNLSRAAAISAIVKKKQLKKHQDVAIRFFNKFVSNCKAIMLLQEAGMTDEAYAIHRLSMEHLFNISALLKEPLFLEKLLAGSEVQSHKALKAIKGDEERPQNPVLTNENKVRLEAALNEYDQNPVRDLGYSIFNAARESEFPLFYNSHYRIISLSHAHSTIVSALRDGDKLNERSQLLTCVNNFLKIAVMLIEREFDLSEKRH
jgi:hypothetical protein